MGPGVGSGGGIDGGGDRTAAFAQLYPDAAGDGEERRAEEDDDDEGEEGEEGEESAA